MMNADDEPELRISEDERNRRDWERRRDAIKAGPHASCEECGGDGGDRHGNQCMACEGMGVVRT